MNNQDNQRQAVLAYLAGILDGEGSIVIKKVLMNKNWNYTYSVQISAVNTNIKVLEMLQENLGGHVHLSIKRSHNRQAVYRWQIGGNRNVLNPLKILLPYLVIKKNQAILAIEFVGKSTWYGFRKGKKLIDKKLPKSEIQLREEFYQKIKKLNAVGAAATK